MYKLLIADDEYEIRNGLVQYFPWNEVGFQVVANVDNGLTALEFLKNNDVDVLLSDVMMTGLNGISLAKEIYEQKLNVKVLFLSGYQEFEYAQKAIEYNVKQYILKPTQYYELLNVFSKIKISLDEERGTHDLAENGELPKSYNNKIIEAVKAYILEHYKDVTLEDVAENVHMNACYLSSFFKQKTGENFSDFVIRVKMEKALILLGDMNNKIYDVSEAVGYVNSNNFTRTFKNFFKMSPREFRNGKNIDA